MNFMPAVDVLFYIAARIRVKTALGWSAGQWIDLLQYMPAAGIAMPCNLAVFCLWYKNSVRIYTVYNPSADTYCTMYISTLQRQNAENLKQIFPEKKYRGLSPNFHIHVSVSELYMLTMSLPFLLEEICGPILGIYKSLTDTWMWKLGLRPR